MPDDRKPAPAGWDEVDTSTPLDVDPASVPQMPGAQEVALGVVLVPGRMETEEEAEAHAEDEYLAERFNAPHFQDLNPFDVPLGEQSFSILIDCNYTTHPQSSTPNEVRDWVGRVVVPVEDADGNDIDLEDAATIAFQVAQKHGLKSPMMSYCVFYFYEGDAEEGGWVQFL